MGFSSGTVSFRRFAVNGKHPKEIDQAVLDKLAEHVLQLDEDSIPQDIEYGWNGGRHIFDSNFSFEHNVFAEALFFGLRVDTNKVPGDLKKAYQIMEEETVAAGNPSGFISKLQKKAVKETIQQKVDDDLRSGKFRRSKLTPILWDFPTQTLFCSAVGATQEKLLEIFERTFGLELEPLTAGVLAKNLMHGYSRNYEDLRPTRFIDGPNGEGEVPEYPWTSKLATPKDFLGNEFLMWLWHEIDTHNGILRQGNSDVTVFFDRSLDLECAYGQTGKDSLRGTGPTSMPEARDALRSGKVPRKVGIILDAYKQQYNFNFNAELFSLGSAKLPEVEEAENARVLFEERVALLRDLCKSIDGLFEMFLKVRTGGGWESQTSTIRKWIIKNARQQTSVAV